MVQKTNELTFNLLSTEIILNQMKKMARKMTMKKMVVMKKMKVVKMKMTMKKMKRMKRMKKKKKMMKMRMMKMMEKINLILTQKIQIWNFMKNLK